MDLFIAIAMLCQVSTGQQASFIYETIDKYQAKCQAQLLHCVKLNTVKLGEKEAMSKCIMERKP